MYENQISLSQSWDSEDNRAESGSKAERCFRTLAIFQAPT